MCDHWEDHSFDYRDHCLQNNVSVFQHTEFVIAFLPESKCLLISWLQSLTAVILEIKKLKSVTAPTFSPPYLSPEKPYAGQEATVRTRHRTTDWFQIGKGLRQSCILSPCLFNLYAEYIMQNARLDESQAGIKRLPGEISTASDMQMIPPLWQKAKRN